MEQKEFNLKELALWAEKGNLEALNKLGNYYYDLSKEDVTNEEYNNKTYYYLSKAYEKGLSEGNLSPEIANKYANCFCFGVGTKKDDAKAFELFKYPAFYGRMNAQENLALSYLHGQGTEKDLDRAIYYFNLAEKQNSIKACNWLAVIYFYKDYNREDLSLAYKFALRAKDSFPQNMAIILGLCCESGRGTEKNTIKAKEYYKLGMKYNRPECEYSYAVCLLNEEIFDENEEEAIRLLKSARDKGYGPAVKKLENLGVK